MARKPPPRICVKVVGVDVHGEVERVGVQGGVEAVARRDKWREAPKDLVSNDFTIIIKFCSGGITVNGIGVEFWATDHSKTDLLHLKKFWCFLLISGMLRSSKRST